MSDRKFEKSIQEKLEELKYPPSATVWAEVEKKIRQKKRRRGFAWIPAILFIIISGYLTYILIFPTIYPASKKADNSISSTAPLTPPAPTIENGQTHSEKSQVIVSHEGGKKRKKSTATSTLELTLPEEEILTREQLNNQQHITKSARGKPKNAIEVEKEISAAENNLRLQKSKAVTGSEKFNAGSVINAPKDGEFLKQKKPVIPGDTSNKMPDVLQVEEASTTVSEQLKDSAVNLPDAPSTSLQLLDSIAQMHIAPIIKPKRNWQWGVTLQAGWGSIAEGGLLEFSQKSMVQDMATNNFSLPLPINAVIPKPSSIRMHTSFATGFFIRRPVSSRINVATGLNYALLQTSIKIGQSGRSNGSVMSARGAFDVMEYYQAGNEYTYHNKYHFIEIPVQAEARLNKSRLRPLYFTSGLVMARLVSTNALNFDGASRIYYKENSLYNKLQLGFKAAISAGIFQKTTYPFTAGPFIHYRTSNLMNRNVNPSKHLLSFGLEVRMFMKK